MWVAKGSEFHNRSMNRKKITYRFIERLIKENLLLLKDLLAH